MRYSLYLFIIVLLSGCAGAHKDRDNPGPAMPDKYLGYWQPYSKGTANVGLQIREDGTMEYRDDETGEVHDTVRYKVIHVTDKYVYTLSRETSNPAFVKRTMSFTPEEKENLLPEILEPKWLYERYHIYTRKYTNSIYLTISTEYCDLSKKDWQLSADKHWQRLQTDKCKDHKGASLFRNRSTWARAQQD